MQKILFINQSAILTSLNNLETKLESDLYLMPAISHFLNRLKSDLNYKICLYYFYYQDLLNYDDYLNNKLLFLKICAENKIHFDQILTIKTKAKEVISINIEQKIKEITANLNKLWLVGRTQNDLLFSKKIKSNLIIINKPTQENILESVPYLVDDWSEIFDIINRS